MAITTIVEAWGEVDGEVVELVTLKNKSGLQVELLSLGATIYRVLYPGNEDDQDRDVVLGFPTVDGYLGKQNPFFWGTTGRMTNRVKNGQFSIDSVEYQLSLNDFGTDHRHHVHGGYKSFDRLVWQTNKTTKGDGVTFSLLSPHGSEGYPGNLIASVTYTLTTDGSLDILMTAVTDRPTVVNMSNHVYFNLAGHGAGWRGLGQHVLSVEASTFTPDDEDYLPTGEIVSVRSTMNDFLNKVELSGVVEKARMCEGYCVNLCIDGKGYRQAAVLFHAPTGRRLEVWSDQPGLELYTGNFLPSQGAGLLGKNSREYCKWGGICLMTQNNRDPANHSNFESPILRPGQVYTHRAAYKFIQN